MFKCSIVCTARSFHTIRIYVSMPSISRGPLATSAPIYIRAIFIFIKKRIASNKFSSNVYVILWCNSLLTSIELLKCKKSFERRCHLTWSFLCFVWKSYWAFNRFVRYLRLHWNSSSAAASRKFISFFYFWVKCFIFVPLISTTAWSEN